ncbi:hypothetical protein AB0M29_18115 [Streptomyces sp. NPDC051976]|uniref:hypothetical protein n=1 Tax=Streptomyces sp. NPDC051976 TaxID=3154947 RepID=UPI00343611AC
MRRGMVAAALGALLFGATVPAATADTAGASPARWSVDLGGGGAQEVNLRHVGGAFAVASQTFHPAAAGTGGTGYGSQTEPAHSLAAPANRVTADLRADLPAGATAAVDVRGLTAQGTWTEWREATLTAPAILPATVTAVQSRVTVQDTGGRARVRALYLSADLVAAPQTAGAPLAAASVSSRVYATREGLVGGTTANGHVIQSNDHFVALPSRRGLSPNGSGQYSVQVCGPVRCETAPVWDVGPWNTTDDYWNPSSTRQSFGDLAQGLPEAQAAYQNGYNGGLDGFGRHVSNPAGIDLADGTFYNVGLNDNGWVTVTYLWTGGGTPTGKYWVDTFANAPVYASATSTAQTGTLYQGTNYVYCKVWGRQIGSGSSYNHWWLRTDPDVGPANQYVSAYYLSRWGNDEAKDNNGVVIPNC